MASINPNDCKFIVDEIQEMRMKDYLRDKSFLKVYRTNFTKQFLSLIETKVHKLKEPMTLSIIGDVRSGKSVSAIYIACKIANHLGFELTPDHICANEQEFVQKVAEWIECYGCKTIFPRGEGGEENSEFIKCPSCGLEELREKTTIESLVKNQVDPDTLKIGVIRHNVFLIDESKTSIYGTGSRSRATKLTDIQNIIAVNNISTIWIRPDTWSYENVPYGLRAYGKSGYFCSDCKFRFPIEIKTKDKPIMCPHCKGENIAPRINRFMMYDLREGGRTTPPMAMVYLPHFADVIPYGPKLEREYLAKKLTWVEKEQLGEGDIIAIQKIEKAEKYAQDPTFQELKMKDRLVYVSTKEGSEITKAEVEDIVRIARFKLEGRM